MPITQGNIGPFSRLHNGSRTISFNAGSGDDRTIYLLSGGNSVATVSVCTYNAVAVPSVHFTTDGMGTQNVRALANPSSGSNNWVLTYSAQAAQTAVGVMFQFLNMADPHENFLSGGETTTQDVIRRGQWPIWYAHNGFIGDAFVPQATLGTPVYMGGSDSSAAITQAVRTYKIADGGAVGDNNTLGVTAGHALATCSFLLNPQGGGSNKAFIVGTMLRRWRQYWRELTSPHLEWDWMRGRYVQIYPSRLRVDMDPDVLVRRFRELAYGEL